MATTVNPKQPPRGRLTGRPDPLTSGLPGWATFADEASEKVPQLRWPASIDTYDEISKAAQPSALLRLFKSPIVNYSFRIDPGTTDPNKVRQAASYLGIPLVGEDAPDSKRTRARRVRLIRDGLRALTIGHAVMEIDGAMRTGGGWDLVDLVYLSPRSLSRWQFVGGTTDVDYIEQFGGPKVQPLPAARLAILRWGLDPDSPYGESMLRTIYAHWLSKDRLMKTMLVAAQRNGMGIPVVEAAENALPEHQAENERLATGAATSEDVGIALPSGSVFNFKGVTGNTYDLLADVKYHDEQMARTLAGQIIQLGQTETGSRALGESMGELLWEARDSVVEWLCESLTDQVLHRAAVWNGADPASGELPSIEWERPQHAEPLTAQDWAALRTAGLIDDSPETRAEFARRYQLPVQADTAAMEGDGTVPGGAGPVAASLSRLSAALGDPEVPGVPQARRPLSEIEDRSRWPFAAIQTAWAAAKDTLVGLWRRVRTGMIGAAVQEVASLDDVAGAVDRVHDLAREAAQGVVTPRVVEQAAAVAVGLADQAAAHVVEAAAQQGVTLPVVDVGYDEQAELEARTVGNTLTYTVADQVAQRTDALAAPDVDAGEVARLVEEDMATLTDALLEDVAGSTATRAQHAGQHAETYAAYDAGEVASAYYSSLLDGNTCGPCGARDGHEYTGPDEIRADFPTGGYIACEGRSRCRCTWVLVMTDETPATVGI